MRLRALTLITALTLAASPLTVVEGHAAPTASAEVTREVVITTRASKGEAAELAEALPAEADVPAPVGVTTASAKVDGEVAIAAVTLPAEAEAARVFLRPVVDEVPGDWVEVHVDEEQAGGRVGTAPLVVSAAAKVEAAVVADEPVAASLQVYSTAVTQTDATASEYAHKSPDILSRAAWNADETLVRRSYTPGVVTGAMIHHTAGKNDYAEADVPGILRSIQAYHINGRGWNDIAYNVLVDRFGRAWEGRGGGVTTATTGGHAFGATNYRTFGISLMGDYSQVEPSAKTLDTLQRVIAWKFRLHGVDPAGRTWGSSGQDGGSPHLAAISGHRDENATSCPGDKVYAKMTSIRAGVRKAMDTEFKDVAPLPVVSNRIAGDDRYSTAARVSELGFPQGATTVFLATGRNFKDALAVGPWANAVGGPVLLSAPAALPEPTLTELRRLQPSRVVLVGGTAALQPSVEEAVRKALPAADVNRVAGENAYLTATAISAAGFPTPAAPPTPVDPIVPVDPPALDETGSGAGAAPPDVNPTGDVFLASGELFPDGLVGGPLAKGRGPLLLAPASGGLHPAVHAELKRLRATHVTVLGGTSSVSEAIVTDLSQRGYRVTRVAGPNRYDTAVAVAKQGFPGSVKQVYLATGTNYPDALVTVGLQTAAPGPLLLSPGTCLPEGVIDYLKAKPGAKVIPIGGSQSLPIHETLLPACR